jgi:hypothetical protein
MIFLIWQVATKVAAVPSCVQVQSHDTIFHSIFPCDMLSAKIIWCEHKIRIKQSFQNRLAFYFHRQSDENRIMRTVKEIRSDFNWSINLVNILMYSDKISFCHFIHFLLSPLFRFGFYHISKEYPKKNHNIAVMNYGIEFNLIEG